MLKLSTMVSNFTAGAPYTYGKAKNDAIPGDGTGTEVVADWLNESLNALYAIIENAGYTVNDVAETISTNQISAGVRGLAASTMKVGDTYNLKVSKAAGVITISGLGGTALSTSNIGYIALPSATSAGDIFVAKLTSNITFNDDDHAASDLTNWLLGVTTGVAWNTELPAYIYGINKDDTDGGVVLGFSRDPRALSFITNEIGDTAAVSANNSKRSIFVFSSITEADYNNKPAARLGCLKIKKVAAANDWTVITPDYEDGFGKSYEQRKFVMAGNQNGADAGYFLEGADTAPIWSTIDYDWIQKDNGEIKIFQYFSGDGGGDGAGAGSVQMSLPVSAETSNATEYLSQGLYTTPTEDFVALPRVQSGSSLMSILMYNDVAGALQSGLRSAIYSDFSNGSRNIIIASTYNGF